MKLLTKGIRKKLPPLYSGENKRSEDIPVVVKFFDPTSSWTWYVTEGEPVLDEDGKEIDFRFFGFVRGFENELGYFSLKELESVKGPFRLGIERDMYFFGKHTLADVMAKRL